MGPRDPRVVLMNKRLISSPARATGRFIKPVSSGRSYGRLTSVTLLNRFLDVSLYSVAPENVRSAMLDDCWMTVAKVSSRTDCASFR